ncbi:MAG TPA: right-handed parallel beta-helix repeat-containing protein [Polyangiales bacterium]|nr:right-handed parallel beta-helix repeat-containing protein [Polyangiales bacterium]
MQGSEAGTVASAAGGTGGSTSQAGSAGNAGRGGGAGSVAVGGSGGTAVDAGRDAAQPSDGGAQDAQSAPDAGPPNGDPTAAELWSELSVMAVVDPMDHGAVGNGIADDLGALQAAVAALPAAGGIVYLPDGATFKKTNLLVITKSHVKLWAPNRQAELFQSVAGERRHQSLLCRNNAGCGFFGLKLRSDSAARFDALEDNQISADHGSLVEVVGCEIEGSAAVGIMLYGSSEHYLEGNYIHHTWADHIHHTAGARQSWVWNNYVFNEEPSLGDDGVACVTYGPDSARCGDMEWWNNTILHTGWGRGYAVIGGDAIAIHDNWAIGVAGAGIIVASEEGMYDTASSQNITIEHNRVYQCTHSIGHPGILISGLNPAAGPLRDIALADNVSVDNRIGDYRTEGQTMNVTNVGLATERTALPMPIPTRDDVRMADTKVLRTRDVSHVAASQRRGLYRIHVRRAPAGDGFQQRFEYVLRGPVAAVAALVAARLAAGGAYLSEQRTVGERAYALLLSAVPFEVPGELEGVPFRELRAGDRDGTLAWLWQRLDAGNY